MTPGCWGWLPRHRTAWALGAARAISSGVTWYGIYILEQLGLLPIERTRENNRIWEDSGLVSKSKEKILDRKAVRNIGVSGTVSWPLFLCTYSHFPSTVAEM